MDGSGATLYNFKNKKIPVFLDESSTAYVSITDLVASGFTFYEKPLSDVVFNRVVGDELLSYLTLKAHKFLYRYQIGSVLTKGDAAEVARRVADNVRGKYESAEYCEQQAHANNNFNSSRNYYRNEMEMMQPHPIRKPFVNRTAFTSRKQNSNKDFNGRHKSSMLDNDSLSNCSNDETSRLNLVLMEPVRVKIVLIKHNNNFVVNLCENESTLNHISEKARREASTNSRIAKVFVGQYCIVKSFDKWCRGIVNVIGAAIHVTLIDTDLRVDAEEVYPISETLMNIPRQAIRINCKGLNAQICNTVTVIPYSFFDNSFTYMCNLSNTENGNLSNVNKTVEVAKRIPSLLEVDVSKPRTSIAADEQTPVEYHNSEKIVHGDRTPKQVQHNARQQTIDPKLTPRSSERFDAVTNNSIAGSSGLQNVQMAHKDSVLKKDSAPKTRQIVAALANIIAGSSQVRSDCKEKQDAKKISRSVVDQIQPGGSGLLGLQWSNMLTDNRVVASILPTDLLDTIALLEELEGVENSTEAIFCVGDLVVVPRFDESEQSMKNVRAIITKIGELVTVAHVDYGTITEIGMQKISTLKEEFETLPYFTCVCTGKAIDFSSLKSYEDLMYKCISTGVLEITERDNVIGVMTFEEWNPLTAPPEVFFGEPGNLSIKINETVRIYGVDVENCRLSIATQSMSRYYKAEVKSFLPSVDELIHVDEPQANQLVLCAVDGKIVRSVITQLHEHKVALRILDSGVFTIVPSNTIYHIDGNLSTKKAVTIAVKLNGVEEFSTQMFEFINNSIAQRTDFVVKSISGDVAELTNNKGKPIPEIVTRLNKSPVLTLDDVKNRYRMTASATVNVFCIHVDVECGVIWFTAPDPKFQDEFITLTKTLSEFCTDDIPPHRPVVGEVCAAFYEEVWSRAVVTNVNSSTDEYTVTFIDFGNADILKATALKALPDASFAAPLVYSFSVVISEVYHKFQKKLPLPIQDQISKKVSIGEYYDITHVYDITESEYAVNLKGFTLV